MKKIPFASRFVINAGGLYVFSGASGAGKNSIIKTIIRLCPDRFRFAISCTTRKPREGEEEGVNYFYITPEEFERRAKDGYFLEHAWVHGNRYGTPKEQVMNLLAQGHLLLSDVDTEGAALIRAHHEGLIVRSHCDFFVQAPNYNELFRRLSQRTASPSDNIDLRKENARKEMKCAPLFRHRIINDDLEKAAARALEHILRHQKSLASS